MSGGLPYPVSNNRGSYPTPDNSQPYHSGPSNAAYAYPSFPPRSTAYDAGHGRADSPAQSSSLSGMFHHAEHDPQQHYSRAAHLADAYSHHQGPAQPRDHVWSYAQPAPDTTRARLDHTGYMSMSQTTLSHSQPIAGPSHAHTMSASPPTRSVTSGPSSGRSRREKPRLELAPDQPLTTQGRPRTRVYVACVQCRNRKIRCDGAKPICHNCTRRTENPGVCNYDPAPRRRGPDRVPGARQRSAGGSAERPPRRRRRAPPPGSTDQFVSPQSASTSPVETKPPFSSTAPSYMTTDSHPRGDNLNIVQEVDSGMYNRHRQGLTQVGRPGVSGGVGAHYSQHHDHAQGVSHTPAAAFEAHPLGSASADTPVTVGYVVGAPSVHELPHTAAVDGYGYDESGLEGEDQKRSVIGVEPGLQFTRETWWDALLVLYAHDGGGGGGGGGASGDTSLAISPGLRESTTQSITADLRASFRASPHWLNFINLPRFFGSLLDPRARHSIQPSLILGALALATFFRSHDQDLGQPGRERALRLRDQAQSALEASLSSRWVDHSLVQAAWLLAFFEICAHPLHSTTRVRSSMAFLDSLLRGMNLLSLDEADPRVSIFSSSVPIVTPDAAHNLFFSTVENFPLPHTLHPPAVHPTSAVQWPVSPSGLPSPGILLSPGIKPDGHPMRSHSYPPSQYFPPAQSQGQTAAITSTCSCMTFTLGHTWPSVREFAPLWDLTPTWQSEWTESDIRKEECRRLVWSSVMLSAGHSSYDASGDIQTQRLFLMDPRNYALLFPGESLTRADDSPTVPPPSKNSVWALYTRAMLMWNACVNMRADTHLSDADKAQFALDAWTEIDAIEEALGRHNCGIERAFLFQGRELLFNSRMCIAYEFQRCLPQSTAHANLLFYRRKAEEWLQHQASLAKRVVNAGLPSVTGLPASDLAKRPFLLFWFMSQIDRALTLWSYDQSLTLALDVAKALSKPVEYLMKLWPCPEQCRRWEELQDKLRNSCYAASVPAPSALGPPQEVSSVPSQGSSEFK